MALEPAPDSFLDLLHQSGLVPDDQMLLLRREFSGAAKPESSRGLAEELVRRGTLTQWQADMLLQGRHRGFWLGQYRILGHLGQGGMSKVLLAEHGTMHRRCAIKILPTKHQNDPDLLNRFRLEARAVGALDHPNIVRAYDFNTDARFGTETHYLVMEYVEGQDLRRMVEEQGPLDCRKAADYIYQAAEGLEHAHAAGFVHRDIKPANLLVSSNGVLKILDLGLARFTFDGENPWQTIEGEQSAVGTADYVAPEQIADSRHVDGRADIYSLGLTFYFLLTGRRPFPKATLVELLMAHKTEQPEPIDNFRQDIPSDLLEIIERMITKSPNQRYQTARDVADKLKAWLTDSAGREYSRISALMAAAMRAKPPADSDDATEKSPVRETTDLQLASLDEEPRLSTPAAPVPSPTPAKPVETAAVADAKPAKRAPGGSGRLPSEKRTPDRSKSGGSSPNVARSPHGDTKRSLSPARPDVLSELLVDNLPATASSASLAVLPTESSGSYPILPRIQKRSGLDALGRSPWFWTGIAWATFFVLLFLLLFYVALHKKPLPPRVGGPRAQSAAAASLASTQIPIRNGRPAAPRGGEEG